MIHRRVEADLSNAALELDNCQKELGMYIVHMDLLSNIRIYSSEERSIIICSCSLANS